MALADVNFCCVDPVWYIGTACQGLLGCSVSLSHHSSPEQSGDECLCVVLNYDRHISFVFLMASQKR